MVNGSELVRECAPTETVNCAPENGLVPIG